MTVQTAPGAARYVGARINRVEDARLLTGRGVFVDDISLPGMLHACFVRSPFARAAILGIDTTAARAVPGVHFVFTAADLNPGVKEQWHTSIGKASPDTPRPPLAEGEVRFVGDPVALVVAESRSLAEDAAELVEVDYEPLPAVVDYTTAEESDVLVHERHGSNVIGELDGRPASTLEDAFASAAHVTSETIHQQAYAPVPMEGRGLVVDYSRSTGDLTIHSAAQSPHEVRLFSSRLLDEHLAYDEDGNPVATTFMDYLLPAAAEVPVIEYGHIDTPSPGPGGYKGVGEGGAIGAPPAVVNAVADALAPFGVTVTRLPLSPSRIVELLEGKASP